MQRALAVLIVAAGAAAAEEVLLEWRAGTVGEPAVAGLPLLDRPPPGVRPPKGAQGARYARIAFAPGQGLWVVVRTHDFRIDTDRDGDLAEESLRMLKDGARDVELVLPLPGEPAPRAVRFTLRFAPPAERLGLRLLMHRAGEVELGGRTRPAALVDSNGDFRADRLLLDLDGDGRVEPVGARFRIAGKGYAWRAGADGIVTFRETEPPPDDGRGAERERALEVGRTGHPTAATLHVLARQGDAEAIGLALELAERVDFDGTLPRLLGYVRDRDAVRRIADRLRHKDPSLRALAVEALSANPGANAADALLRRRGAEKDPNVRAVLAAACHARPSTRSLRPLVARVQAGPLGKRGDAVAALVSAGIRHEAVRHALLKILATGTWESRVLVVDALGARRDLELARAVAGCLRQPAWQLRIAAAESLGRTRLRLAVEPLVRQLEREKEPRVKRALGQALYRVTGSNFGDFADIWSKWWAERKESFEVPPPPVARPRREGERRTSASFYGVPVESQRVVFVIDQSASMSKRDGGRSLFDTALDELTGAVAVLGKGARFNVILFGTEIWKWQDRLVPASRETQAKLARALAQRRPTGATYLYDALEAALLVPDVETVYLLSDGAPSGGKFTRDSDILREIRRLNLVRRVQIHCIAIGYDPLLLKRLAQAHGGTYVRK